MRILGIGGGNGIRRPSTIAADAAPERSSSVKNKDGGVKFCRRKVTVMGVKSKAMNVRVSGTVLSLTFTVGNLCLSEFEGVRRSRSTSRANQEPSKEQALLRTNNFWNFYCYLPVHTITYQPSSKCMYLVQASLVCTYSIFFYKRVQTNLRFVYKLS